ncbi:beta-1,6-N-acetylglucosaminyltransferase [Thalassotalea litorea]|uniref:beta-1,6-N-acetylglucosaminyltransferase n=1 Tax=Thalassotalea litorea TaxID=2020715 RepID=UPI003736E8A5
MRLAYAILAHEPFEQIRPLLQCLTDNGDIIALHYDLATQHRHDIELIKCHFPNVILASQVAVEWGESSIVMATLNCLKALLHRDEQADYVTLLSGSCFPVKSSTHLANYLAQSPGCEYIEAVNVEHHRWITEGIQQQRWELPHWCNWRKHPKLFSWSIKLLTLLGVKRKFPLDFPVHMGSQWWTLSWLMVTKVVALCEQQPRLLSFLTKTWIPDEFFFQTLVAYLIDNKSQIKPPLMNYQFNCKGIPKIFSLNDIHQLQALPDNKCFTRKIQSRDLKFVSLLSGVYLNKAQLPTEVNIIDYGKIPDNLRWYKRSCLFDEDLDQLPVPCSIIIWHKGSEKSTSLLAEKLTEHLVETGVYGNLFAQERIDYGSQKPLVGYQPDDTRLRDYDRLEFIQQLCLQHPKGVVFFYQFCAEDELLKVLSSARQVQMLEVFDMSVCQASQLHLLALEQQASWKSNSVPQFTVENTSRICACISAHQQRSPFHQALMNSCHPDNQPAYNLLLDGERNQSP